MSTHVHSPSADLARQSRVGTNLKRKGDAAPEVLLEMCSVRVGQTLFGVPITYILEILGKAHPQAIPLAPAFVGGLVHYRGDVLTTVSLRQLLGMPPQVGRQDVLVLESDGGWFGLLVDSVGEVLTVSMASHEPNPSTLNQAGCGLFAGAYKLKEGLLVMLDAEKLDPEKLDPEKLDMVKGNAAKSAANA